MNGVRTDGMIVTRLKRALTLAAAGCLLAGCAGGGKSAGGGAASTADAAVKPDARYKVVADQADFFHNSVMQVGGADEKLRRDTRVTLLKRYGGYAQITANGSTGYVASDAIAPLNASDLAAEEAATRAQQAPPDALAPANGPGGAYSIPPEATHDTVLPVPDAGPVVRPTPNPMFRY